MARIQIADLEHENFIELTAEEQCLIQGGWIVQLIRIVLVVYAVYRHFKEEDKCPCPCPGGSSALRGGSENIALH
jgi:hypothetical protein